VHDPNLLHAAFTSAETLWDRETTSANGAYQHASLTFFRNTVRTPCGEQTRLLRRRLAAQRVRSGRARR
jgi:predicted metalloprotease